MALHQKKSGTKHTELGLYLNESIAESESIHTFTLRVVNI